MLFLGWTKSQKGPLKFLELPWGKRWSCGVVRQHGTKFSHKLSNILGKFSFNIPINTPITFKINTIDEPLISNIFLETLHCIVEARGELMWDPPSPNSATPLISVFSPLHCIVSWILKTSLKVCSFYLDSFTSHNYNACNTVQCTWSPWTEQQ